MLDSVCYSNRGRKSSVYSKGKLQLGAVRRSFNKWSWVCSAYLLYCSSSTALSFGFCNELRKLGGGMLGLIFSHQYVKFLKLRKIIGLSVSSTEMIIFLYQLDIYVHWVCERTTSFFSTSFTQMKLFSEKRPSLCSTLQEGSVPTGPFLALLLSESQPFKRSNAKYSCLMEGEKSRYVVPMMWTVS